MEMAVWYFDNIDEVMGTVDKVRDNFPCFISVTTLELNWAEVTVQARVEDMASIEREFSKFC